MINPGGVPQAPWPPLAVNGRPHPWREGLTVAQLLLDLGAAGPGVAVERNGLVVSRSDHAVTRLAPGDRIEVVRLVGGG